jgi:hypothetical protein
MALFSTTSEHIDDFPALDAIFRTSDRALDEIFARLDDHSALDGILPAGTTDGHIFRDSAGDYYRITGGRFQAPGLHKEP